MLWTLSRLARGKETAVVQVAFSVSKDWRKEPWSLRAWVVAVAAISAAGAILTGALAGWYSWHQQKLRLGENLVASTRAIIQSTDHELTQAIALARGLAAAPSLERGDVPFFETRTRSLVEPFGYFLILSEPGARKETFNTSLPPGAPLPELPTEWVQPTGELREPVVRPLIRRATDGTWTTAVQVSATDASGRTYVITIGIPSARFQRIIDEQRLPPEWSPVILDQEWTIVARGITPEKYIGAKGANPHLMKLPSADSTYEGRVLEGYATVNARSRSERFGWTAAVAVPQSLLFRQFFGPTLLTALAGFIVSLSALIAVGLLASKLVRDVRTLSTAMQQLSDGQSVTATRMGVKELNSVSQGIEHTSVRLKAEEQFRKRAVDELAHRLRNKVATIQAIIYAPLRGQPALREEISARLRALAATDDLLVRAHGDGAHLADILRTELAPYDQSRVIAEGPDVALEPNLAFTMALLFHELATNAAKYGALSAGEGHIEVRWSFADSRLDLEWRERGGPPVHKAERRGFGTQLVAAALAAFGGDAQTNFEPTGLVVRMRVGLQPGGMRVVDQTPPIRDVAE